MSLSIAIVEGAVGWAVGRVGNTAAAALMRKWREQQAKAELVKAIFDAIDAATVVTPNLTEDFRSETFIHHVVAPIVVQFLGDFDIEKPDAEITQGYIEKFVEPQLRGRTVDQTLSQLFRTERRDLERGVSVFLNHLRTRLYASKHWREPIRDQVLEEVLSTVIRIEKQLPPIADTDVIDVELARADANEASKSLKYWPQTISGEHIDRAELDIIQQRIREHPYACTLVIGESGSGKSALFAELIGRLQTQGVVVFAIKADLLPNHVKTLSDISDALGLRGNLLREIDVLARTAPIVVLIDQLDAVSEVMDRSSDRMRLLLQIAHHFQDKKRAERVAPPVHIIVSSRPFEADYDARFQSLNAKVIQLALPSLEQISDLLTRLNVSLEQAPAALHETLRRPFALRIFVDILRRGIPGDGLIASQLLNTWLTSAELGDSAMRLEVLSFLERLAGDMTESESLWRPIDIYETQNPQAVQVAEAAGIVARQNGLVGFSHQAWLDDFQARNLPNASSLANYAWQRQDGLFARATVLRALQRLRAFDVTAYAESIDLLLGKSETRRHLRHLVVDLIAGQKQPSARERGWIQQIVRSDVPLARRALARITPNWGYWRKHLLPLAQSIMGTEDLQWSAVQVLIAEARLDDSFAARLIETHWNTCNHDLSALEVFTNAGQWSPAVVNRLRLIFSRQRIEGYLIVSYAESVGDDHAADLLGLFLECTKINYEDQSIFYGLGKVAIRSPHAFSSILFPWFVDSATRESPRSSGHLDAYPCSTMLFFSGADERSEYGLFEIMRSVLMCFAKEQPHDFLRFIKEYISVEVAEVQALIAEGFAAASMSLAIEGTDYLLGDSRRLQVGRRFLQDAENVNHLVEGWSTQALLRAIVPHLDAKHLERIRRYIESWQPYLKEAREESDATTRRQRRFWAEDMRLSLLAILPQHALDTRRYRQIQDWRAKQPVFRENRGRVLAAFVHSPMSAKQMENASDEDVFRMLDEVADDTEGRFGRQKVPREGGARELAQAFAEFGKIDPSRAVRIAEQRFCPGRQENAAGELIRVLAEDPGFEAQSVRRLIWKWHFSGFATEGWRRDVARAMQSLANRNAGLVDEDVKLLESWIVDDHLHAEKRIAARLDLEQHNRSANRGQKPEAAPIVFRRRPGGIRFLPQGNFTFLSAMAAGLLGRAEAARDEWLSALERHVLRSEDPAIWTDLLIVLGDSLNLADRQRAKRLIQAIWNKYPSAFSNKYIGEYLWKNRDLISRDMMNAVLSYWLNGEDVENRQISGELLMATVLIDPDDKTAAEQLELILAGSNTPERLGALFTASTAWHEELAGLRPAAHEILMRFAEQAAGLDALAIAGAVTHQAQRVPDFYTKELLSSIAMNPQVLRVCLDRSFTGDLQELLLNPGFDELVLEVAEHCTQLMFAKDESRVAMPYGENFVSIAIAIQRSQDPLRRRAMDLYERLLDGAAYGAEEAAAASLSRV